MLKTIIGGFIVGIANIIPGVSGGTMMVIFGIFGPVMTAISEILSKSSFKEKAKHLKYIGILLIGVVLGLFVFANVMEIALQHIPTQTKFCFVGMIALSIPILKRKEMPGKKINIVPFIIGCAIILLMVYFAPAQTDMIITEFPPVGLFYLFKMILLGVIAGAAMFIPGVSGSMLLLIIGEYYLFNSLIANVTTLQINVLIPLGFMAFGILLGIVLSSKATAFALKKNRNATMSLIFGLVIASCIMIIPFDATYDMMTIITCIPALALGGFVVAGIEKFVR